MPNSWLPRSFVRITACVVIAFVLACPFAHAELAIPNLKARVTDLTGTLTPAQVAALEQKLADFERRKGAQLATLIVGTTKPETIEQYAVRVFEHWKLGRKGMDDGVLFIIARNDRRMRLEVGYGLEGVLPDAIAKRVIDETVVPYFRRGEFFAGIDAGLTQVIRVVDGEHLPPVATSKQPSTSEPRSTDGPIVGFVVAAGVIGMLLRAVFGRLAGASLTAGIAGFAGWFFSGLLAVAVIGALVAFIFVLMAGFTSRRGYGGWSSHSGWGGSGGGGGGFSGGGGSSGGGGASGSW